MLHIALLCFMFVINAYSAENSTEVKNYLTRFNEGLPKITPITSAFMRVHNLENKIPYSFDPQSVLIFFKNESIKNLIEKVEIDTKAAQEELLKKPFTPKNSNSMTTNELYLSNIKISQSALPNIEKCLMDYINAPIACYREYGKFFEIFCFTYLLHIIPNIRIDSHQMTYDYISPSSGPMNTLCMLVNRLNELTQQSINLFQYRDYIDIIEYDIIAHLPPDTKERKQEVSEKNSTDRNNRSYTLSIPNDKKMLFVALKKLIAAIKNFNIAAPEEIKDELRSNWVLSWSSTNKHPQESCTVFHNLIENYIDKSLNIQRT